MQADYLVVMLVTLFLAFLSHGSSAIVPAEQREAASFLTRRIRELPVEAEEQNSFDNFLFQCYYRNQPMRSESEMPSGPRSKLHGVCDRDALTRDITPTRGRRHHHYGRHTRHADRERSEAAAPENFESNYDEIRDGLYSVLTEARYAPSRTYAKPDSAVAEPARPTFSAAALEGLVRRGNGLISNIYGKLVDREPADFNDEGPARKVTRFGRFYLSSERFEYFLSTWEKNDDNARFHISQADVDRIRDEVVNGRPFSRLSSFNKQLFGKLLFVRNTLETYAMMREVMKPLGLESSGHRTAKEFLQAMYGYLMAVHKSNGKLAVVYSVGLHVFSSELLSFAYAGCHSSKITTVVDGREIALEEHIEGKTQLYIESMIILFKAWLKSTRTYIDPAVLSEVTDKFYSYVRPSNIRDEGC
ncbi:hypothetical protein PAPHI01_2001 [Pancytospora philotis]|nr:hypothetical protein PAPHI01_2001 [Pancytospora philotis]